MNAIDKAYHEGRKSTHGSMLKRINKFSTKFQSMLGTTYNLLLSSNFFISRKFFLGLVQRINNLQLLLQFIRIFSSVKQKDFTYSRSQCNSSLLLEHGVFSSSQHNMKNKEVEKHIQTIWQWFASTSVNDKASFIFFIANEIDDSTILHQALNLAKTIYIQQNKKLEKDDLSISSYNSTLSSSDYSFHTNEHPNVYMIASLNPQYHSLESQKNEDFDYNQEEFDNLSTETENLLSSESSMDPRIVIVSRSRQALSGVLPTVDFVSKLPIHLAKKIIGLLSVFSQSNAALVNKKWYETVRQVQTEKRTRQEIFEEAVMMQGVSAKGAHPNYAKKKVILVPMSSDNQQTHVTIDLLQNESPENSNKCISIPGVMISKIEMEERNVYCGSYNVLILDKRHNKNRVMHYGGGNTIASGSSNGSIRLFDVHSGRDILPIIQGHPGSIKSIYVADSDKNYVFSGSYDTTIRRWHVGSSSCHQIMHGHSKSIITLDFLNNILVSGSKDGLVKVWNVQTGKCTCTFRHAKTAYVLSVKIRNHTIVSSCDRGMIKVWNLLTRKLEKCLVGHTKAVNQVSMDDYYIVSASDDEYVFSWMKEGNICHPVKSYRHPKEVLCVELKYLRIISGCGDGKIRVLHLHTGECLRVIRGNSKCEPIVSLCAKANRLIINMESNLLLLQFEELELNYEIKYDQANEKNAEELLVSSNGSKGSAFSQSYVRACRNRASSVTCSNIRTRPLSAPVEQQLPMLNSRRPHSSVSALLHKKNLNTQNYALMEQCLPTSSFSTGLENICTRRKFRKESFNVHNSKAMSVISEISSVIIGQDSFLNELRYPKNPPLSFRSNRSSKYSSEYETNELKRNRLHLRIGSIHHNIKNGLEDINTALNGAHPDVREVYHSYLAKI